MTREQNSVCIAVAKHFGIKKAIVLEEAKQYLKDLGADHPVIELDNCFLSGFKFGISKNTIGIGKMLFYRLLEKTELFSDMQNLLANEQVEFVAFSSGGALLTMYECAEYDGIGGVFVKKEGAYTGYVIEPISHFLKQHYPVYSTD